MKKIIYTILTLSILSIYAYGGSIALSEVPDSAIAFADKYFSERVLVGKRQCQKARRNALPGFKGRERASALVQSCRRMRRNNIRRRDVLHRRRKGSLEDASKI